MARSPGIWHHRSGEVVLDRTHVMGILNVTPDSFSDGGRYADPVAAARRALEISDQGASLLDIGGESTRPGAEPVTAAEEWRRVGPVLEAVSRKIDIPISIDTRKADIAEKALDRGAAIVNDVTGLADVRMARLVAKSSAGVVVMHMQGDPKTMQRNPQYADPVSEIKGFLARRATTAIEAGIRPEAIAVDPGVGFGKKVDDNLAILLGLDAIAELGHPVVVGVSRKAFLAALGAGERPEDRLAGSLAAASLAVAHGANVVRAHDVPETVRAVRVADAILRGRQNL